MKRRVLYTIGYEGAEFSAFAATLQLNRIKKVIDVRDFPQSRKRGFSKTALATALAERGILYVHLKALGDPKPGRDAARRGDFAMFRKIYKKHLSQKESQDGLRHAAAEASSVTSSLLCYERDFENCHRSIVADALSKSEKFTIRHIYAPQKITPSPTISDVHKTDRVPAFG